MVTMCGKRRSREGDEGEREGCCPWSDPSPLVPAPRPTCRRRSAPPSFDPPIGRSSPHGWQSGGTALIWAAIRGHVGIVQILCESGADLEAKAVRRGRYGPHSTTAPLRSPLPRLPHCDDDDPPPPARARARARAIVGSNNGFRHQFGFQTALSIAESNDFDDMAVVLRKAGAR